MKLDWLKKLFRGSRFVLLPNVTQPEKLSLQERKRKKQQRKHQKLARRMNRS